MGKVPNHHRCATDFDMRERDLMAHGQIEATRARSEAGVNLEKEINCRVTHSDRDRNFGTRPTKAVFKRMYLE